MPFDLPAPVAFYAPLKPPDDPVPSGDRTMARLLLSALGGAGMRPDVASRFRAFSRDGAGQDALIEAGAREAERVAARLAKLPPAERPRLWFTYHSYYKAPDLLGPMVSRALGIPYAVAEASHAQKRAEGVFAPFHERASEAARRADLHLVLNRRDREGLVRLRGDGAGLVPLPPFTAEGETRAAVPLSTDGPLRLATVAMMRLGDKLSSYELLAEALALVCADWRLDIAGNGPARALVEAAFAELGPRVRFHGLVSELADLPAFYEAADLLVWPGVNEAFGMTYLEAARHGRPALAMRYGGVGEVVEDDVSGLLTEAGNAAAFAAALDRLAGDRGLLRRLGEGALRRAEGHHSFATAVRRLARALGPLVRQGLSCAS